MQSTVHLGLLQVQGHLECSGERVCSNIIPPPSDNHHPTYNSHKECLHTQLKWSKLQDACGIYAKEETIPSHINQPNLLTVCSYHTWCKYKCNPPKVPWQVFSPLPFSWTRLLSTAACCRHPQTQILIQTLTSSSDTLSHRHCVTGEDDRERWNDVKDW